MQPPYITPVSARGETQRWTRSRCITFSLDYVVWDTGFTEMKKTCVSAFVGCLPFVFMVHVNLIAIIKRAYAPQTFITYQPNFLQLSLIQIFPGLLPLLWFQPCCQANAGTSCCGALSLQPGNINEQVSLILRETGRRWRWWMGLFVNASEFNQNFECICLITHWLTPQQRW